MGENVRQRPLPSRILQPSRVFQVEPDAYLVAVQAGTEGRSREWPPPPLPFGSLLTALVPECHIGSGSKYGDDTALLTQPSCPASDTLRCREGPWATPAPPQEDWLCKAHLPALHFSPLAQGLQL